MQQLKAELVVFKGLMSNVSAASTPLTLFPGGLTTRLSNQAAEARPAALLGVACWFPLHHPSPHFALLPFFPLPPGAASGEKEGTQPLCWRGSVPPPSPSLFCRKLRTGAPALPLASSVAAGEFLSHPASLLTGGEIKACALQNEDDITLRTGLAHTSRQISVSCCYPYALAVHSPNAQ